MLNSTFVLLLILVAVYINTNMEHSPSQKEKFIKQTIGLKQYNFLVLKN